jgi:hypothetical protein
VPNQNYTTNKDNPSDDKDAKEIKYVVTNPSKDLKLKDTDLVFVLA